MKRVIQFIYFFSCTMMLYSTFVFAYFDPSVVTYAIQIIATIFIAAGAFVGVYWQKIKKYFRKKRNQKKRREQEKQFEEDSK